VTVQSQLSGALPASKKVFINDFTLPCLRVKKLSGNQNLTCT